MTPRTKRQRISEDGAEAVTSTAEPEASPTTGEAEHKENLKHKRTLFVRSLAPTTTTDDLTEHFSQSYPLKHAIAVLDPATKQCKGYGFVTFADAEDAQRAKEEFEGSEIHGKKIKVEVAEPRHRDIDSEVRGPKRAVPSAATTEAKAARKQQQKEDIQSSKLIIRNLPWSIKTSDDLALLFRSYGKVKYADLPKTRAGLLRGFGFVLLRGRKNAEKALQGVNGKEIDGRTLAVDWAVEKDTWENLQNGDKKQDAEGGADESVVQEAGDLSDEGLDSLNDDDSEAEDSDLGELDDSDEDGGVDVKLESSEHKPRPNYTIFVRNVPFTADDESLEDHFSQFGRIRYARVVVDRETERPKGTAFVCFAQEEDMINCLKDAPKAQSALKSDTKEPSSSVTHSILQNEEADPTGKYTMDGRVLQVSRAVDRSEAARLTAEGAASRFNRDKDKRRLYLLSEGTISKDSPLYEKLPASEVALREQSAKQRKMLIQTNPSLHLSLTRLSIRNLPRSVTSKDLKALARQAIVGFAEDVKEGKREKLTKEELSRGGKAMLDADQARKRKGKGVVRQAKVVFETPQGSKVAEETGAGRSRGYGFIEYWTHRTALMALRWLNGHAMEYKVQGTGKSKKLSKQQQKEVMEDRKKRLIVEFAIENANVVNRRSEREANSRARTNQDTGANNKEHDQTPGSSKGTKRKRGTADAGPDPASADNRKMQKKAKGKGEVSTGAEDGKGSADNDKDSDNKVAKRSRIIMKKRMARREKRKGKA